MNPAIALGPAEKEQASIRSVPDQSTPGRPARPSFMGEVTRFLQILWQPGDVREVRIPKHDQWGHTASGYFDSPEKLAQAALKYDGKANIYLTLNPTDPALLARSVNHIKPKAENTTSDADILVRRFLFIDIDSVRPSGISATQGELAAAGELLAKLTQELAGQGWPDPLTCMSGNGYYALYGLDLPNTPDTAELVGRVLKALAQTYDTPAATIDTTVSNASRIMGLVGTLKMKGDATEDRPHRRSELLSVPDELGPVAESLLEEMAEALAPAPRPASRGGSGRVRPLIDLLTETGIDYREQPPDGSGITWYHLKRCPFHSDGRNYECGVGQKLPDGPYAGKCFHPEGAGKGWQEFKQALGLAARPSPSRRGDACLEPHDEDRTSFPRTDSGNAELFAHLYGDTVRYDHRRAKWLVWDTHHWREDTDGKAVRLAIETARTRFRHAESLHDLTKRQAEAKFAIQSENRARLEAMLAGARSLHPLTARGDEWDRDPFLLGVRNGVVDLKTGRLRPGTPEDNITLWADIPYLEQAPCPRWLAFLEEVFQGSEELIDFVWRAVGYSLSGDISAQCVFLAYGQGANGKSVFLSVLRELLGSYAYNAPFSTFELRVRSEMTNDVAQLAGRRLVTASETNEGTRLNEARIKALTGGDPVTARFLYGEHFAFRPQAKIFLAVNHLPVVEDLSYGFWRRVRLLPFGRTFAHDADPQLEQKLHRELPGILQWALAGCLAWQKRGLEPPASVLAATESYRETSDPLAEFIEASLVMEEVRSIGAREAYAAYQAWTKAQGMTDREVLTLTAFGRKMGARFAAKKGTGGKRYLGVGLAGDPVQEVLA